jgi:predicted DsbA family dithiol-disulfide isomerase
MLVASSLETLKKSHAVMIQWRSYELRPAGGPPISPEYRARILAMRPQMIEMAREKYGLEINCGPFGINSRPSLVGAKFAEAQGKGEAYHTAVFHAYWQMAQNIAELDVLAETAVSIGLDRNEFLTALNDEQFERQVSADIEQAFAYGLHAVPALVFANKYLVSGSQPYETLVQVVERVWEDERVVA